MNDPLGLFGEEEQTNADPLGLFGSEDTPQEKGFFAQQGENMLGLGAALGDMAGGLVKMPLGIGAGIGAKIRGGDGYNTDELRAAAQQEVERLIPSIGKSTGLDKNKTYELAMKPFELIGQGIDWAGNQAGEITGSKDVAGASKLGLDIATLGMGIPGAKLAGKGLARVAEAVDPGLRNAGKAKPRSSVDALLEEVKNTPVEQPASGQLNLFPDDPTGQASPYDAGQAGVTSPITPKRAAAQMELPLRNDLERTYYIDTEGVSIPPEQARVVDLAKDAEVLRMDEQARLQGNEDFLGAKQQEMWATDHPGDLARDGEMAPRSPTPELTRQADWVGEREANRPYTEQRADNGLGGDRPFSRQEFEQIVDNLAKEPGTKFERPIDMEKAYSDYVEQVNPRNTDMFDIPARKEAWLATAVDNHPAVKAATAKVASIENTISSLEAKVASGEAKATQLIVKQKQLEAAKAKAEKATTNVASALAKTKKKTNTEYEAAVLAAVDNGTISSALLDVVKNNTATKQLERVRTKIATELKKTSNINYDRLDDLYHQEENIRLRIEHDRASSFVKNLAEKKKGPDEGENPYNSDIPARKEAWLATAVDNHPAVKAATAKVASIENTISSLEAKVASGEAKATQLIVKQKQLEAAKAKAEKATTNVAGALAKTQPLNKGFGRKQRGAVDPRAFRVGFKGRLKSLSALTDKLHVDPVWQDRIRAALGGEFQRNQDGTPMIMLHGTRNEIKGKLRTTDEGFHAGLVGDATMFTQKANTKAGRGVAMGKHSYENGQLHPIVIKKGNYPYIPIDANLWEPQAILKGQTLAQQHIMNRIHEGLRKNNVPQPVVNQLLTLAENARGKDAANRTFSNLLKEAGIDGFFYRNTAESPKQLKLETLANRKGVEKRKEIISNSVDPESFVTWNPNNYTSLYSDKSVNPYNSDIVNMHSGIPFTREHWNKLREVGNAMIENAQQAIEFAKNVPDVDQTMVQRGINALTKGGSYLKAKVNSPVVHFAVDRLLAAEGAAKSAINEKIHGEYLTALRELSKQEFEDAYKILNQADQTQRAITPEAMTRHGISPKVQEAVIKHQELMADVLNQVNAARELAGKKPVTSRQGYSAMNMSGDFRKVVYKTINGVREVVGVISANSKTFGKNSLTKLEKLIGEKNPEYEFGPLQDLSTSRTITKGTPDAAFMDVLNTIGENNPNFAEFLKTLDEVHRDNPSNFLGMQQHAMQKKGVWGMEGRKQWLTGSENAKAFFENQVRYAESAYQWGELSKAGLEISEVLHDPVVLKNHPNASKLAQEYLNNAMGLQTSRMGKAVDAAFDALFAPFGIGPSFPKQGIRVAKEVANTAMMSLSPTFLAIQLLQPVASLPGMVMYLRGKGMDSWAVAGSAKAMGTLYKISTGKPLNAIERGAVEYAKKNHVYATDMVQHSMDTQKGPLHYTRTITQAPQAHIETGTRASVFHTLVQTLHDGGLTPEKGLYEQAQRFTDLAMNNYSNMEKPMIYNALGPLGSMAYNLKSFAHNEISRWSMYAREIPNSGDAKPLLAQMATTIAFAGLMGLPFYSQWEQLYGFITKKLGEPRSLTLDTMKLSEDVGKHLGPKGAYALSHGMFATVGADISSRIGLGDVIPSSAADAAFAGGGKLVEMGKATGRAMINPSEENLKSAATNLAPPFLQGVAKDAWYTKGNLGYSIDPTNLKPTAELNDQDRLLGKLGILGINKSVQQTKNYELGQLDREFKGIRDKAMNTIAQDIFRDRAVLQKTIDKYFIDGQGDPKSFEAEVNALATKMNLSPNQLALLRDSASNSITRQRSLMRRVQ